MSVRYECQLTEVYHTDMSGERAPLPTVGNGLLRGGRTRSYGSLVRSPVHQRRIEHKIQPGETLPGLALKYGVSMEQIKRANRMYTNDSIFLKKSLSIPVLSGPGSTVVTGFQRTVKKTVLLLKTGQTERRTLLRRIF
ncbi:LysM and putative peptidoglycan-binding domain-containing protein 1 [Larimichthys crocea]|uniref:Uncharacterized protein n=1 Tax=Larimichthys crocea TaxID=215358 RepID=A0ACD3QV42_LARCR|nr:LysM and putative peptidoglycan-binding domain-containing protein 1 [Larimichthys crocea]